MTSWPPAQQARVALPWQLRPSPVKPAAQWQVKLTPWPGLQTALRSQPCVPEEHEFGSGSGPVDAQTGSGATPLQCLGGSGQRGFSPDRTRSEFRGQRTDFLALPFPIMLLDPAPPTPELVCRIHLTSDLNLTKSPTVMPPSLH